MRKLHVLPLLALFISKSRCTFLVRHERGTAHITDVGETGLETGGPSISAMHIESTVNARYAEVVVTTNVENSWAGDKETTFFFYLPHSAFISKFSMKINNDIFNGVVMEKEEAKKLYEGAKERNETAGHVEQESTRPDRRLDMDMFTVSVNLAANASAVFELRYQELIERRNGIYKQVINVKPNQIVHDFEIVCLYNEPQGFESFEYILPRSNNAISLPRQEAELRAMPSKRILTYKPSASSQSSFDPITGIAGDFIVTYDVVHENSGLVIFTDDGYIVSYYSPSVPETDVLPKDIIFIIDISGSMSGQKIKQARNALIDIVTKLRSIDRFNIILFDNNVEVYYTEGFVQATLENKDKAKAYATANVRADGGTGINDALLTGIRMFDSQSRYDSRGNIIIFLTDGQPTVGVTNTKDIRSNVRKENYYVDGSGKILLRAVIYCLAFGFDMNYNFLSNLAEENGGNARQIYERVDAKDQLVYFFDEVADPYLSQVSFSICQFSEGTNIKVIVDEENISRKDFPYYFVGSEIVVVAKIPDIPLGEWRVCITGDGGSGSTDSSIAPVKVTDISVDPAFIENLYAYKQIKHYLVMADKTLNESLAIRYTDLALNMSLEHHFVTPLTSMVVTLAMKEEVRRPYGKQMDVAYSAGRPDLQNTALLGCSQQNVNIVSVYLTTVYILLSRACIFNSDY